MRFLYVEINGWFEVNGKRYKKVSSGGAKLNGNGNVVDFAKSTKVLESSAVKPVRVKPQVDSLPPIKEDPVIVEEKGPLEELYGQD